MKIIQVVPSISQEADGVSNVVKNLCESIVASGFNMRLASLDLDPLELKSAYLTKFPLGLGPRNLGRSPQMRRWLKNEVAVGAVDIIHNHGLWMMPNVYAGEVCIKSSCQLMFSPHGTLSSWALSKNANIKNVFWKILQKPALQAANCLHATAESEFEDIRRLKFDQPVCIIPCGVDVQALEQMQDGDRRRLLFLGRIHPKKGVDVLLHAWHAVEHKFPDWDLHVVGPDNGGFLAEMQDLAIKLKLKRVTFSGPLFGDAKLQAYKDASLYVLPTHSENFGITVAEALAAGTPAIVTHGAPWAGLAEQGAGWWIEVGIAPLVACLEYSLSLPPERLAAMGTAGHKWMKQDFSWPSIAKQFLVTYRWLLNGGEVPSWVRLDY